MISEELRTKYDRLRTLSRFIRNQATLTDERSPRPGPGEVKLNHEAAMLVADSLDAHLREMAGRESAYWSYDTLAEFFKRHGTLSKAEPTCFICRRSNHSWPPAHQHPDLPNILVCDACWQRAHSIPPRSEGVAHAS
jgi:hypothetical protein